MKFWAVVLLSHVKDHLLPRRMQFTASRYLFLFQSYKDSNIPNQRDIEKALGTRICDINRLESQFLKNLNDLFLIKYKSDLITTLQKDGTI